MRRLLRRYWWAVGILVIVGAPVAWYLGSPLFINKVVDEPFPGTSGATPAGAAQEAIIARGTFTGADNLHRGEGTAVVYRTGQNLTLRFDAFKVTNGPDLRVILTKHAAPRNRSEVMQGYLDLGKLKGNIGSQNYPIPMGTNLSEYRAVVIYCFPFNVVFSIAPLNPGG